MLTALASFLFTGCCDECFLTAPEQSRPPVFDGTKYFPLHNDNLWQYIVNGDQRHQLQIVIADTQMWKDIVLYKMETRTTEIMPRFTFFNNLFRMGADTLYEYDYDTFIEQGDLDKVSSLPWRMLNPLRVGDSLTVRPQRDLPSFGYFNWIIISTNSEVVTSLATYTNCLYLQLWYKGVTSMESFLVGEEYYAEGVGLVEFREHPFAAEPGDLGDITNVYRLSTIVLEN